MNRAKSLIISFLMLGLGACAQPLSNASKGALAGGALGAGTGAIIGNQTGRAGEGVAIGAGLGALGGALIGNATDRQDVERQRLDEQQRRQQQELERQRRELEELKRQQNKEYY